MINCHPETTLWEGTVFTGICLSMVEGMYPSIHLDECVDRGVCRWQRCVDRGGLWTGGMYPSIHLGSRVSIGGVWMKGCVDRWGCVCIPACNWPGVFIPAYTWAAGCVDRVVWARGCVDRRGLDRG